MKISQKVRDNFELYLRCYREFGKGDFNPWPDVEIISEMDGLPALEWFKIWDSEGRQVATREPKAARQLIVGKKLLNFQIEQWAEGVNDAVFCVGEFMEEYDWLPDWVWDSLRGQLHKKKGDWEFPWHIHS